MSDIYEPDSMDTTPEQLLELALNKVRDSGIKYNKAIILLIEEDDLETSKGYQFSRYISGMTWSNAVRWIELLKFKLLMEINYEQSDGTKE